MLGTTGVAKRVVVSELRRHLRVAALDHPFEARDFERDYVEPLFNDLPDFLESDETRQEEGWGRAWRTLLEEFPPTRDDDLLLSMHGVLVRDIYGVRSLVEVNEIAKLCPTHVVTMIDDVYLKWLRTETRAGGLSYVGRPTLLQLLDGRRAELLIGDTICRNVSGGHARIQNWFMAVRHPAQLLARIAFGSQGELRPVYLSFPISEPRRMNRDDGDKSGIDAVNGFLSDAREFERSNSRMAAFCPLSIDELPILGLMDSEADGNGMVNFEFAERWNVSDFYGSEEILMTNSASDPDPSDIELDRNQVKSSEGMIRADVAVRDYRLVSQSRRLVVFNPVFNNKLSGGVDNEIAYAAHLRRPVHIFQDEAHDSEGLARQHLLGSGGALGSRPSSNFIVFHESLDAALTAAAQ